MIGRLRIPDGWLFQRAGALVACLLSMALGAVPTAAQHPISTKAGDAQRMVVASGQVR